MVAGMWANTNLDDTEEKKGTRTQVLEELDEAFDRSVERLYGIGDPDKLDMSDPFIAAMDVPELPPEASSEELEELRKRAEMGTKFDHDQA